MATKRRRQTDEQSPAEALSERESIPDAGDPEFFEQLQKLTAEDWQAGHRVYIYRTWPVIDRRDEHHYVAKVSEPFDEDFLLRHYGSGKYYMRLNNRQGETINSKTASVHDPSFPPKVSPDEVVKGDPRNDTYFKVWPPAPPAEPAATPDNSALRELSRLATKVLEQRGTTPGSDGQEDALKTVLVKWALEQTTKERESNDPSRIASLLKELKSLLPQQVPDDLGTIDRVLSIIEKLTPRPAATEAADPIVYIEKILRVADKLRPPQPEAAPAPTGDGSNLAAIATIVHEVAGVLKDPVTIAAQVWAAKRNAAATGTVPMQPQRSPNQPPESRSGPQQPASPRTTESQPVINLANAITPVMLKWIHGDAPGAELGSEFAAWVADGWGTEDLKSLQAFGSAAIIDLYRQSPVWPVLFPMEEKFRQFVGAFVAWTPAEDGEQESLETEEPEEIDV
jgi:hypothetical protein